MTVAVSNSRKHLTYDFTCLLFAEKFNFNNFVEELSTTAEVTNDIEKFLILKELVDFDNIWVILLYRAELFMSIISNRLKKLFIY